MDAKREKEIVSALTDLANAVEHIEIVCEDLIDCNDDRLINARHYLGTAWTSIKELNRGKP